MNTSEITHRLRVGVSLVVGFLVGKFLAGTLQHHASEFFIGGFMLGFIASQAMFRAVDAWKRGGNP
jgi:hypothetical protein